MRLRSNGFTLPFWLVVLHKFLGELKSNPRPRAAREAGHRP